MFKDYCNMKKNYNCPATEVMTVQTAGTICAVSNETFSIIPGTPTTPGDPVSDPGDGR